MRVKVLNTLTHEFGHNLGLRHSNNKQSIMAPYYKGWDENLKLETDDIQGNIMKYRGLSLVDGLFKWNNLGVLNIDVQK